MHSRILEFEGNRLSSFGVAELLFSLKAGWKQPFHADIGQILANVATVDVYINPMEVSSGD